MSNEKKGSEPASPEALTLAKGAIIGLLSNFDKQAALAALLILRPGQPTQKDIEKALGKIEEVNKRISARQ